MKSKISRRSFLRNIAAAGSGAAALGLLAGCSSSSTAASSGSTAAAEDKYTPGTYSASKTISYSEIGVSMTFDANSITACEITSSGEQDLLTDDKKTAMAKAIVEGQSADVDAVTSCTLVALSALFTTLGLYQKLAAKAGAGSLVPITGFANAVVSAAIEFKTEGRVLGTGAKMFLIAGPVIVYGTLAAVLYGSVCWLLG